MKILVYATDLSDREWKKLARLLPSAKQGGRPRKHARRLICDAIFWLVLCAQVHAADIADRDGAKREQIERSLNHHLSKCKVRGLILTGLDDDHASPAGVDPVLTHHRPDWVM